MRWFRRTQNDFENEIRAHLELEMDQLIAEGHSPSDAERLARKRFGNVSRAQQSYYDGNRFSWLEDLRADVRYALRLARHHPGFSLNVIATAALGIAACVATFSLVSGILLTPLNFPGQDRVFSLELHSAEGPWAAIPASTYRILDTSRVFTGVASFAPGYAIVEIGAERVPMRTGIVAPAYFRVYAVSPVLGRFFDRTDVASSAPVVVLSYETWLSRFGGDSSVLSRRVLVDDAPRAIIGIAPPKFLGNFEGFQTRPEAWIPEASTGARDVNLTMRLADGISKADAEAYLSKVARAKVPSSSSRDSIAAVPVLMPATEMVYGDFQRPLLILLGAVGLVLILVMANVATMFLARAVVRQGEIGVRGALGASAGRQLRQLLAEAMTLAVLGGIVGVAAAAVIVRVVRALGSNVLSRIEHVSIDWRVMLFATVAVVLTGGAGGIAHYMVSRPSLRPEAGTRISGARTSIALVVAQVALSLMLLVGAGLLVKGFLRIAPRSPGFITANRAIVEASLADDQRLAHDAGAARRAIQEIIGRIDGIPGVERSAMVTFVPLRGNVSIAEVDLPEQPSSSVSRRAYSNVVTPNYFEVMGIPLKAGRKFGASDVEGSTPVAIISDSAATRWWPGRDPIGRQISVKRRGGKQVYTIVGVVAASRVSGRNTRHPPELFWPLAQSDAGWATFVVASRVAPSTVIPAIRGAIHQVAPRAPVMYSTDYETLAAESVRTPRFYSIAMSVFAGAAVLLSALGIYGLLAFGVAQRRREIGIRMALGATARQISVSILARAAAIGGGGVAIGLLAAFWLSRYLGSLLTEVTATDRAVFFACGVAGLIVAAGASMVPAYRATHIDPVRSLRA
jgi:predicted permease